MNLKLQIGRVKGFYVDLHATVPSRVALRAGVARGQAIFIQKTRWTESDGECEEN